MKSKKEIISGLLVAFFVMMIASPKNSLAFIVPSLSIQELISRSDIVCKGSVVQVVKIGESERRSGDGRLIAKMDSKRAVVHCDRILKGGKISETIEVEFEEVSEGSLLGYEALKQGEYVLLFLKQKNSRYALTSPYCGKIHISNKALQIEADGTDTMALLQQELLNSLRDEDPNRILPSLEVIERLNMKAAAVHIEKLLDSNDLAVKGQALSTLIMIGSIDHIAEAISYIDEQPVTKAQKKYKLKIIYNLEKISDIQAVPELHVLLKHQNTSVRREVARSLRGIKSPSSIPYLVAGIDDSNVEVRYQCMMGLAKMLAKGGDWAPAYKRFLEDESKPILLWKAWWKEEGELRFGTK